MKKFLSYTGVLLWLLMSAHFAFAEMITFGGSLFADRSNLFGRLYIGKNDNISLRIYVGHGLGEFGANFACTDKWQEEKVIKATRSIADYINKNHDIDPFKMLSNAGLSGCKPGE